ncbi:methyltransferase domain-containing protein [Nakamurella sp. A5-74]|uniref:Methyltransferase domain-containing protein n=1 Tax=Nakamurella sp. A5-74 TaxID=3158264 RepID=A0AAU8DTR6_9ACTN
MSNADTTTDTALADARTADDADRELKARHRALWALGDYTSVATDVIALLGPTLVAATQVGPGDRVLDVAAGAGNVAIPAALAGADVIASDLCPELLADGERLAAEQGATLRWQEADAEALPFADASFDVVTSCVGVMFAPHHQQTADELVRVCRPGGRIGLISWTPAGFIGRMFGVMRPHAAPPAPGAQPPPLWGDPDHVRELLGDRVTDLVMQRRTLEVGTFSGAEHFRDFFKARYGPTIATYARIAEDTAAVRILDDGLLALADEFAVSEDPYLMEWEYLLVTATGA